MSKRFCPITRDAKGKPVKCGDWCGWYNQQKNDRYSGCSLERLSRALDGIAFMMRQTATAGGPAVEAGAADQDVPF